MGRACGENEESTTTLPNTVRVIKFSRLRWTCGKSEERSKIMNFILFTVHLI
jgi:hypothetical protein